MINNLNLFVVTESWHSYFSETFQYAVLHLRATPSMMSLDRSLLRELCSHRTTAASWYTTKTN